MVVKKGDGAIAGLTDREQCERRQF
jgi:hypothetical protein